MYFFVHSGFCSCAVREESRQYLREIQLEYSRLLEELVNSGRYDTRDDFTVVLQPHMRDIVPPLDVSTSCRVVTSEFYQLLCVTYNICEQQCVILPCSFNKSKQQESGTGETLTWG